MRSPYTSPILARLAAAGALGLAPGCGQEDTSGAESATASPTQESATDPTSPESTTGLDTGVDTSPNPSTGSTTAASGSGTGGETGLESTCADDTECGDGEVCFEGTCHFCIGTPALYNGAFYCCEDGDAAFNINAPTVEVEVQLSVDGQPPPKSSYDFGHILLRYGADDDLVYVGRTNAEGPLKARVLDLYHPYEVVYEAGYTASFMPINSRASLDPLNPAAGVVHPVQLTTVIVEGALSIDGQPAPASAYDSGALYLYDATARSKTLLDHTFKGNPGYRARVLADRNYEVRYGVDAVGTKLPRNADAYISEFFAQLAADTDPSLAHNVAIATTMVGGAITLDGAPPPASEYENGAIFLRDTKTGDVIPVGETKDGALDAFPIVTGSYELYYARIQTSGMVPSNEWAALPDVELGDTIALESQHVEATLTIDGAAPVATPGNRGRLSLRDAASPKNAALLGLLDQGVSTGRVLADITYDLVYGHESTDGGLPANTRALLGVPLEASKDDVVLKAEVTTALLSGAITLNKAPPPVSAYDNGRVFLKSASGDQVLLGQTRDQTFERRVITGTYDLCYAAESGGKTVPRNGEICFKSVTIDADNAAFDVDIPSVTITINNASSLGNAAYDRGRLYLRHLITGDEVFAGTTDMDTLSLPMVPGPYWLIYQVDIAGPNAPQNQHAHLACQTVGG